MRFTTSAALALILGCAGQAQPIESKDTHDSRLETIPDSGGEWAYIVIQEDLDSNELAPVTGSSHDPEELPAGNIGTPEPPPPQRELPKQMRIKKCGADADCGSRACLRPTGGPHPYGVCGDAVDQLGRSTPNRIVRGCGIHAACPGGSQCVLAYKDYGMCFALREPNR
jgi:hypothetical protein